MTEHVELLFPLAVEDDWPPVAVEGLPFRPTSAGYESTTPPLFVKGLSVGDVISATIGKDGRVESWHLVSKSAHSVVWILRIGKTDEIEGVLARLESVGCGTVRLPSAGSYSVDVPARVPFGSIDEILETLDPEKVAVAYPSFRHAEEDDERGGNGQL